MRSIEALALAWVDSNFVQTRCADGGQWVVI
jgi:hypothetical protein